MEDDDMSDQEVVSMKNSGVTGRNTAKVRWWAALFDKIFPKNPGATFRWTRIICMDANYWKFGF